jgi:surface protein
MRNLPINDSVTARRDGTTVTLAPRDERGTIDLDNKTQKHRLQKAINNVEIVLVPSECVIVLKGNASGLFNRQTCLRRVDADEIDTSSVTDMSYMFCNCTSLASLGISSWDTSSVTDTTYMFFGCQSLASLPVSDWDTSLVTDTRGMFCGCESLETLDVSRWPANKTYDTTRMFNE